MPLRIVTHEVQAKINERMLLVHPQADDQFVQGTLGQFGADLIHGRTSPSDPGASPGGSGSAAPDPGPDTGGRCGGHRSTTTALVTHTLDRAAQRGRRA